MKLAVILLSLRIALNAFAVCVTGNTNNTNTPAGDCGQKNCAIINGTQMVEIIGPHAGVTAQHLQIVVGQSMVLYAGTNFIVTNTQSLGELTVVLVAGTFPTNSRAILLTNPIEIGQAGYMWGRGSAKGAMVTNFISPDLILTNINSSTVRVVGRSGTRLVLNYSTNLASSWVNPHLTNTVQSNGYVDVGLPYGGRPAFFRAQVLPTLITNGWMNGANDHMLRWGINTLSGMTNGYLFSTFDLNGNTNEGCAWPGDSGGGFFIQEGGVWKLAGIIQGVDQNLYRSPSDGSFFYGMMVDRSGLELWDSSGSQKIFTYSVNDGPNPIVTYYTRITDYWWWLEQFTH